MINLYYHGGSTNHGCEAIVRSTSKVLGQEVKLFTTNIEADKKYNLDNIVELAEDTYNPPYTNKFKRLLSAAHHKFTKSYYLFIKFARDRFFSQVKKGDVYLSIGGDNYCYAGKDILGYYNQIIHEKGGKTVLWGCSFEPTDMTEAVATDIKRYDLIVARESISFNTLKAVNPNTVLIPDPAFQLDKTELLLPERFIQGNTVGINVSPLIMGCETNSGITEKNYSRLLEYIIENTDMQIALIPHVVEEGNDDRVPLRGLYEKYQNTGRVVLIEDCNAMELKGYISRCRFFVGARTHATIAAYSTCIPTLVVGYSVKARGIAKDIFGTSDNYVLPVQSLKAEDDLVKAFQWIVSNEKNIYSHLKETIPEYCERVWEAGRLVRRMAE